MDFEAGELRLCDSKGSARRILLAFEFGGTKRLFHLVPQLGYALNGTRLAVLDEIDGDLHIESRRVTHGPAVSHSP